MYSSTTKKASRWGAFFVVLLSALAGSLPVKAQLSLEPPVCQTSKVDEQVTVKQVIDGDTLRLEDGRLVRLIGINSPELGRDGKSDEAFAIEAKQALERLLGPVKQVQLRHGVDPRDRYNRLLAHVYLPNGQSLEAALLQAGMAAHIVVPPNNWNSDCYRLAEKHARKMDIGVWSTIYRPINVLDLPRTTLGFRVIEGHIERLGESRKSLWLNFSRRPEEGPREGVALRIARDDLRYFTDWEPGELQGRQIEVRGWLYANKQPSGKQQLVMQLRHPAAVTIIGHQTR